MNPINNYQSIQGERQSQTLPDNTVVYEQKVTVKNADSQSRELTITIKSKRELSDTEINKNIEKIVLLANVYGVGPREDDYKYQSLSLKGRTLIREQHESKDQPKVTKLIEDVHADLTKKFEKLNVPSTKSIPQNLQIKNETANKTKYELVSKAYQTIVLGQMLLSDPGVQTRISTPEVNKLDETQDQGRLEGLVEELDQTHYNRDSVHLDNDILTSDLFDYKQGGNPIGREVIKRFDAMSDLRKQVEARLKWLEIKKQDLELPDTLDRDLTLDEIGIFKDIERCHQLLQVCDQSKGSKNWIGSNDFRDLLNSQLNDSKILEEMSLDDAVNEYDAITRNFMPAAVNFRNHAVVANAEGTKSATIDMVRLGVITDVRNGYTNLQELKEMVNDDQLREKKVQSLEKKLNKLQAENKDQLTPIMISLKYAINQISSPEQLELTIRDRRQHLEFQFMQLLNVHIENVGGPENVKDLLPVFHLLLLNQNTKSADPSGWYKNEANFILDMATIFQEMNGMKLMFDGVGPYVDSENKEIHFAQKVDLKKNQEPPVLLAVMGNVSVQGLLKNNDIQQDVNKKMISGLKLILELAKKDNDDPAELERLNDLEIELKDIEKRLTKKKQSDFDIAERIMDFAFELENCRISTGCMSAKDRTGILCARLAVRHALRQMKKAGRYSDKLLNQIYSFNMNQILKKGRPAVGIASECNAVAANPIAMVHTTKSIVVLKDWSYYKNAKNWVKVLRTR